MSIIYYSATPNAKLRLDKILNLTNEFDDSQDWEAMIAEPDLVEPIIKLLHDKTEDVETRLAGAAILLESASCMFRESGETASLDAVVSALKSDPDVFYGITQYIFGTCRDDFFRRTILGGSNLSIESSNSNESTQQPSN